jgi:hypothetical protein
MSDRDSTFGPADVIRPGQRPSAAWLNRPAAAIAGAMGGPGVHVRNGPGGLRIQVDPSTDEITYEWRVTLNADRVSVTITPGTIECAPSQTIEWASITGYAESPTLELNDDRIWVEVAILGLDACTAALFVGTAAERAAALDDAEKEYKVAKTIAKLTWVDSKITKVLPCQFGPFFIAR